MSYIARINIGQPIGQEALQTVPGMSLEMEDIRLVSDDEWRLIYWASGDDFKVYESALPDDPTISSYTCLTQLPNRRLYRVSLSKEGYLHTLANIMAEQDIVARSIIMSVDRVEFYGRFPSRDALYSLRDACRDLDRDFELLSLFEETSSENAGEISNRYDVTDSQQEALLAALEQGYFSVPRQTTMEDIANSLEISTSALSTRLRRGQQALLRDTLAQETVI